MPRVAKKPRLRLHQPPMEHCIQLERTDCGIAASAALAGESYTVAWLCANTYAPCWPRWGLSSGNVIKMLEDMTERTYRYHSLPKPRPLVSEYTEWPTVPATVIIRADGDKKGHFIAFNPRGKRVHDPNWHCGIPLATYKRWIQPDVRVIGFILPCEDEKPTGAA